MAERILDANAAGNDVVVVVSAMGDTTDELIDLAEQVSPLPAGRELDMLLTAGERISMALLAMAIGNLGQRPSSFTGSQAGVITDDVHGKANIIDVTPGRIERALNEGAVAIVAGFQGVNQDTKDITTLGRGGSDTTAVALAAALADRARSTPMSTGSSRPTRGLSRPREARPPQLRRDARVGRLRREGASPALRRVRAPVRGAGARAVVVQHPNRHAGHEGAETMEQPIIAGVAHDRSEAKVTLVGVPDVPGKAAHIFEVVAGAGVNIDMIVQNVSASGTGKTDISLHAAGRRRHRRDRCLTEAGADIGYDALKYDDTIGKLFRSSAPG